MQRIVASLIALGLTLLLMSCAHQSPAPIQSTTTRQFTTRPGRLDEAIRAHDVEAVRRMLRAGADANARDASGETMLQLAVWQSWIVDSERQMASIVKLLLDAGADPAADDGTFTCIDASNGSKSEAVVQLIRDNMLAQIAALQRAPPAGPRAPPRLMVGKAFSTAKFTDSLAIRLRLARGANPNEIDETGDTVLCEMVAQDRGDVVADLLDAGADINQTGRNHRSPIFHAIVRKHPEIAAVLLSRGADPYIPDNAGLVPLCEADGSAAAVFDRDAVAAARFDQSRWGPSIEGIQCRLRRQHTTWPSGKVAALRLDLWSHWTDQYRVDLASTALMLEIDGQTYHRAAVSSSNPSTSLAAPSSQDFASTALKLDDQYGVAADGAPLILKPGSHTAKVTVILDSSVPQDKPLNVSTLEAAFTIEGN